jgi:hypothetical protein
LILSLTLSDLGNGALREIAGGLKVQPVKDIPFIVAYVESLPGLCLLSPLATVVALFRSPHLVKGRFSD